MGNIQSENVSSPAETSEKVVVMCLDNESCKAAWTHQADEVPLQLADLLTPTDWEHFMRTVEKRKPLSRSYVDRVLIAMIVVLMVLGTALRNLVASLFIILIVLAVLCVYRKWIRYHATYRKSIIDEFQTGMSQKGVTLTYESRFERVWWFSLERARVEGLPVATAIPSVATVASLEPADALALDMLQADVTVLDDLPPADVAVDDTCE